MRAQVSLADKYELESGRAFMTGVQALVRLPMLIRQIDRERGLNTAGFISGYRGSPLGTYDMQLAQAQSQLEAHDIVVQRGINEDLGATAVWGTQHVPLFNGHKRDGVFGLWYGKGPGVDRTGDVFKHANFAGTSALGGVLALAGDDHSCKSSTLPNQSEFAFADAEMPTLSPSTIDEVIEFGAKGIQLSRYSGCWIGVKTIADLMDASTSAVIDPARYRIRIPDYHLPDGGLNIRLNDPAEAKELRHRHHRLPAAQAFARFNGFDPIVRD
ncbi:MAG: indolepyruvate ferredoxin oxidoreductase family protein, partial [Asticcacaulis sp.]